LFYIFLSAVIYTASTVLLGAQLSLPNEEENDIQENWTLALDYLKRISPKCVSAERCLKVLEVMHAQIIEASTSAATTSPAEVRGLPIGVNFQPTSPPPLQGAGAVDWNMQDLVWNNLPWDWDLVDDLLVDGRNNNGMDGGRRQGDRANERQGYMAGRMDTT